VGCRLPRRFIVPLPAACRGQHVRVGLRTAPGAPTLVFDRSHRLIAEWPGSTYRLLRSPVFGPGGEVFALASDGSILKLRVTLPGA
jgi:hypothetical protein